MESAAFVLTNLADPGLTSPLQPDPEQLVEEEAFRASPQALGLRQLAT
jgi:hypothetical protein